MDSIAWDDIQKRCNDLRNELTDNVDPRKRHAIQKELSQLSGILEKRNAIVEIEEAVSSIKNQAKENNDPLLVQLYEEEVTDLLEEKKSKAAELDSLMFPPDPFDKKNVFLEIRAGAGGQEAALFAADLLQMYTNYALSKGWKVEVASISHTDLGGMREVVLDISGTDVYGHLKYESGVHRVQRVPLTETAGRIHTSTATVAVLPEADEVDVTILPDQLRIDVFRASGAGGQHVNTTDSAVRITHLPSGVVVSCQDERSQHKNKAKAMKMLQSRLLAAQKEKHDAELSEQRKELVGTGMRAEKVRTYNFPQNRITDHQVELTLKKLDVVIKGLLDEIIEALIQKDLSDRRNRPFVISK